MRPNIQQQDRSYRHGLVLGLTMAEIMVLILFALLLALASALFKSQALIREKDRIIAVLMPDPATQRSLPEVMKDLREQQAKVQKLQAEIDRLQPFEAKAKQADRLQTAVTQAGGDPDVMKDLKEVTDRLNLANQVLQAAGEKPDAQKIADILAAGKEAGQKINNLQGQNVFLENELKSLGKGNELPSCWTTPDGHVEYIFDALIKTDGVQMTDNAIPHRADEEARLPISMIRFGSVTDIGDFTTQTRPIYDWSEHEKCRFYVRIRSSEPAMRKDVFAAVTDHFYFTLIRT
jgi:hypothetical protein